MVKTILEIWDSRDLFKEIQLTLLILETICQSVKCSELYSIHQHLNMVVRPRF